MISPKIFALVLLAAATVSGLPNGAPASVCEEMTPKHSGIPAKRTAAPYKLDVSATNGNSIEVTINGQEIVQGFMLQARVNGVPAGTFTVNDSYGKIVNCKDANGINGANTITHQQKNSVKSVKYTWTAPPNTTGQVQFLATVAQDYANFWVQIPSAFVKFSAA